MSANTALAGEGASRVTDAEQPVSECLHQGPRPLIWHHHDASEFVDWCRCQDCSALVAMEPPDPEDDALSDKEPS